MTSASVRRWIQSRAVRKPPKKEEDKEEENRRKVEEKGVVIERERERRIHKVHRRSSLPPSKNLRATATTIMWPRLVRKVSRWKSAGDTGAPSRMEDVRGVPSARTEFSFEHANSMRNVDDSVDRA